MKHRASQFDLPGMADAFNLAGQSGTDGERAERERQDRAGLLRQQDKQQGKAEFYEANAPATMKETGKKYRIPEVKLLRLRDAQVDNPCLDTPEEVEKFWRENIPNAAWYDPDRETLVCLMLNTRRRIIGFTLVSSGTLDTILVHPREVFKAAIIQGAAAIIIVHNHPGGDPTPSEADIRVTRDLRRAGELMKIDLLDHVIIGDVHPGYPSRASLREQGYFTT